MPEHQVGWGRFVLLQTGDAALEHRVSATSEQFLRTPDFLVGMDGRCSVATEGDLTVVVAGDLHEIRGRSGPPTAARALECVLDLADEAYDRFVGDAVVLTIRPGRATVFRELTGARPAHLSRSTGITAAASDWFDLARLMGGVEPDPHWTAHLLSGAACAGLSCPDRRVQLLLPGQLATLQDGRWTQTTVSAWRVRRVSRRSARSVFTAALDAALKDRTASASALGVSLSGGLDSTSVLVSAAVAAASIPRHAFAIPFTDPEGDERAAQACVAEAAHAELHWVDLAGRGPMGRGASAASYFAELGRHGAPSRVPNWFMLDAVADAAERAGVHDLMGGEDADSLLGWVGLAHLSDLLVRGRWIRWWSEATAVRAALTIGYRRLLDISRMWLHRPNTADFVRPSLLAPDLPVPPCDTRPRAVSRRLPGRRFREAQQQAGFPAHTSRVHDEASRAFLARGLRVSQPLMDRRVMEVAMGLPSELVVSGGVSKVVLRVSMQGRLPDDVRLQRTKAVLSAADARAVTVEQRDVVLEGLEAAERHPWFAPEAVRQVRERFLAGDDLHTGPRVARVALWLSWLEQYRAAEG